MLVCPGLCFRSDWRQTCVLDHGANRDRADLCRPDPVGIGLIPGAGGEISERQAARTPARKTLTSPDNCSACLERLEAAERTWPAAPPVSLAAALTPPIFVVTSCVACAVWVTLRAISAVAAPCSSIAEPIVVAIALTSSIVAVIPWIASTASLVALWIWA